MRVWNWPVLPVMPCVTTLEFLSMRMGISFSLRRYGGLLRGGDHFFGGLAHVRRGDDRQPRVGEDLLPEIDVRALEAHDEGHLERDLARRAHHARRDHVAFHDA